MAFGMKHWIGLTTLGLLLVSIWKLPPSAMEPRDDGFTLPEVRRAEALSAEIDRTHQAIVHLRWTDSLSALTVRTAVDGLAIGFPENRPAERTEHGFESASVDLSEERKEEFRENVRAEVAALTPRADVAFGFYLQPLDHGAVEGVLFRNWGQRVYLGVRDGQPYCVQVFADLRLRDRSLMRTRTPYGRQETNTVGACRPYLKFGMPGGHVGAWMVAGASDFALAPAQPMHPSYTEYRPIRRTFFGLNFFGFRTQSVEVDRCMAGIADGCLAAMTDPRILGGRSPMEEYATDVTLLYRMGSWYSPFGNRDDYLLGDLEAEFGPERFQRFWSSEEDVPEAFRAAFGMDMGEWLITWVDANMDISPPGPQLSKSAALGGLLAVSLMAALAGAWARRRRVN